MHYVLKVRCKTPIAMGKAGFYSGLDAVLLHRLCLWTGGDIDAARERMPLERDGELWACGGGYNPQDALFLSRTAPKRMPAFRLFLRDGGFREMAALPPDDLQTQINAFFGQETEATGDAYAVVRNARELHFRFRSTDPEQVLYLLRVEPFLGPGHSVGWGEIERVDLEEKGETDALWVYTDPLNRLTRPVPMDWTGVDGQESLSALEAPYWSMSKVPARVPYPVGVR